MKKSIVTASLLGAIALNGQSQNILFNANELYPEGIAYNQKQKTFYVSSVHYGKIGKVDWKGNYMPFIDDADLVTSTGIFADEKRNMLYVCVADPGASTKTQAGTQGKFSKLNAYNLTTGNKIFSADLGALNTNGGNFANDLALDKEGNIYVTNSFSPIVYKITQAGRASIFATTDNWKGEGFNLNGIVYHPDGYLIVAKSNNGNLYKVPLATPNKISLIETAPILGADGIVLNNKNELVVISNAKQEVYQLKTTDNWQTASVNATVKSEMPFPTTGVLIKNKYYVLNAKLGELFDSKQEKTSDFLIQEIKF
jgi:sugar lactone lactonase YvrE